MPKQYTKTVRLAAVAGVITLILLFTGCQPAVSFGAGEPTETEQAATPTMTATATVEPSPSPTPTPTAALTPTPAPVSVSLPPIPEDFLVEDEYWEFALFVRDSDDNPSNAGIVFSGFPEGMKLYAPMSGYITRFSGDEQSPHNVVYISESADRVIDWGTFGPKTGRFIIFRAEGIELLEVGVKDGALYVEKGEPFAKVTKKSELFPGEYKEKPELFVLFNKEWADMLDVSVEDPKQYLWSAIQIYE